MKNFIAVISFSIFLLTNLLAETANKINITGNKKYQEIAFILVKNFGIILLFLIRGKYFPLFKFINYLFPTGTNASSARA